MAGRSPTQDSARGAGSSSARGLLALQLRLATISGLLRRHGSEVTDGGCRDRGCAGAVGLLAAGGEAADPAALHPGAGRGLGGAVPWPPAPARAAPEPGEGGPGGPATP